MAEPAKKPAPKSTFRKEYEDPVISTMKKAGQEAPQYEQLMDYLTSRRAVPPVSTKYLREGLYGVFEHPGATVTSNTPADHRGRVTVNEGTGVDTLVHELTHSAVRQLQMQYGENGTYYGAANKPTQFTNAADKLLRFTTPDFKAGKSPPAQELAKKLDPAWLAKNQDYRASQSELPAFAMGNMTPGARADLFRPPPAHLEATLATEMMILLDLATREQKKKPQSQGR